MRCRVCKTEMKLTDGWVPSYSNPDNSGLDKEAEPYCPKCNIDEEMNKLIDDRDDLKTKLTECEKENFELLSRGIKLEGVLSDSEKANTTLKEALEGLIDQATNFRNRGGDPHLTRQIAIATEALKAVGGE